MFKRYIYLSIFILYFIGFSCYAEKYCTKNDTTKTYVINFFGESYKNVEDRKTFGEGIGRLITKFKMGDRLKIVVFDGTKATSKIDACYPGCPKKGIVDSLLDSECQAVLAQRDKKKLDQEIYSILKNEANKGKSEKEYNIFDHIRALDNYYRNRNIENTDKIFVFHSLIPFGANGNNDASFNKPFVKAVESEKLNLLKLPNKAIFINPNNSISTEKYWKDLELNNHASGLKLKIKKEIIN